MKNLIFVFSIITTLAVVSCNSNSSSKDNISNMEHDSMPVQENTIADMNMKVVATTFTNVDPAFSTYMQSLVKDYLALKNALINENETAASSTTVKMDKALKGIDKSLLSEEQKKVYNEIEEDLKEHVEHISKSKIEHQREHFAMMSKDMYDLVKAFGAGMTLYHDHCPMYKDGSMWLSESKDIKNPFYGYKMMTCGSVEEMMK